MKDSFTIKGKAKDVFLQFAKIALKNPDKSISIIFEASKAPEPKPELCPKCGAHIVNYTEAFGMPCWCYRQIMKEEN